MLRRGNYIFFKFEIHLENWKVNRVALDRFLSVNRLYFYGNKSSKSLLVSFYLMERSKFDCLIG